MVARPVGAPVLDPRILRPGAAAGLPRKESNGKRHSRRSMSKLDVPVLALGGDRSFGTTMAAVIRFAASDVGVGVVPDSGHWIMEENPRRPSRWFALSSTTVVQPADELSQDPLSRIR